MGHSRRAVILLGAVILMLAGGCGLGDAAVTGTVTYRADSLANMVEKEIRETQRWERLTKKNDWTVRPEIEALG